VVKARWKQRRIGVVQFGSPAESEAAAKVCGFLSEVHCFPDLETRWFEILNGCTQIT
jgi:hypothetical protein